MLATIDKYFNKNQEDAVPSLHHIVHLILREAVANPVAGDPIDRDVLGIAIRDLYGRLERIPAVSEQVAIAQSALEAIREYNRETNKFVHKQVRECARALASVREFLSAELSVEEAKSSLEKLAEQLKTALDGPPKKVKPPEPVAASAPPIIEISPPEESSPTENMVMEMDAVTGLPQRQEAEICVAELILENRKTYFLAVIIDQLAMIEQRYGGDVKNNVVVFFSQLLSQTKKEEDLLFRWSDRCFLVLMNRAAERHYIRDEARTMLSSRYRTNTHVGGRPVMLNVGACHKLWQVSEFTTVSKFAAALDRHLAAVAP